MAQDKNITNLGQMLFYFMNIPLIPFSIRLNGCVIGS